VGVNDKTGAIPKSVDEIHPATFPQIAALPGGGDAEQESLRFLKRDGLLVQALFFTIEDNDWRLADVQLQRLGPIGVNEVQEVVH
jgi:hypothetical protein